MGNYNPAAPQDLGFEWVAIRDEDLEFSPAVNAFEQGYGFTLAANTQVGDARFYIHELPPGNAVGQVYMASVYPRGYEDISGPVNRVIIPCNSGTISGSGGSALQGAVSFADAVADPSDGKYVAMQMGGTPVPGGFDAYFATNAYANQLTGKRILGVNVLYAATIGGVADDLLAVTPAIYMVTSNTVSSNYVYYGMLTANDPAAIKLTEESIRADRLYRVALGEVDYWWSTTLSPFSTSERLPWTYTALQRFEVSNGNRRSWRWISVAASGAYEVQIHYIALEILYCEEQRTAVGARAYGTYTTPAALTPYVPGVNIIPMRTIAQVANPVLTAGDHTTVISSPDVGDVYGYGTSYRVKESNYPLLNALRELYSIPPHPGLQVKIPFPTTDTIVGRTFEGVSTPVLPQISLHTTGGSVVTAIHPYGRQIAAPVYGAVVATQGIINAAYGSATPTNYPQVRFWARRFGDTTVALNIHNQSGLPAQSASITVADFDELPEILDGWKEVTLTFTGPTPSFTASGSATTYEWSASGENVGNRWEILGATSLAISGVPGNLLQTVPTAQVLDSATYGGATAFAAWLQPNSGATASDTTSDISVIFAQNMPTVSGLGISLTSQTVTGIGLDCGLPPGCIPTGIGFNTVSWVSLATQYGASSAPITGFGYYELQRMDTIDTDWQTIMEASDVARASFYDYESRVGIQSSYRIRACDSYEFCGPWSSTVNATLTSPGVYGTDGNGVLIFTSNERQNGSINLAYTEQWNSAPETQFEFPEAGNVKLQEWYNHDFVTAFRPLERGGERFEAILLVQAAAASPPVVEGVFRSLRDMAWDTVQYICVRNELGDRWWATVIVPDGRVRRNRRLQLARVQIIEVSDTPCVAEPDA